MKKSKKILSTIPLFFLLVVQSSNISTNCCNDGVLENNNPLVIETKNAHAKDGQNLGNLGHSIDLVKHGFGEIKFADYSIIDEDYLYDLCPTLEVNQLGLCDSTSYSEKTAWDLEVSLEAKYSTNKTQSLALAVTTAGIMKKFKFEFDASHKQSVSHYLKIYEINYRGYSCILPNVTSNLFYNTYIEHLSTEYLDLLNDAFAKNDFNTLFEDCGTHIVAKAEWGSNLYANYCASSNKFDVSANLEIGTSENDEYSVGNKKNNASEKSTNGFDLSLGVNYTSQEVKESFYCWAIGGKVTPFSDKTQFDTNFDKWAEDINDSNSDLYKINSIDKVIPIWDLLPSEYNDSEHIEIIKNAYDDYVTSNTNTNIISSIEPDNSYDYKIDFNKEESEFTVSYDDYNKNKSYTFDFDRDTSDQIGLHYFLNQGYRIYIFVTITRKEINDGYQDIYVFAGETQIGGEYGLEWGRAYANKYWTNQEYWCYETPEMSSAQINALKENNKITIKLGSHGHSKNQWIYKNLRLEVKIEK